MKFKIGQTVKTHYFEDGTDGICWLSDMLKLVGKTGSIDGYSETFNSYSVNNFCWPESALTLVEEKREPDSLSFPGVYYQPLFDIISQELNVIPVLSDMDEIIRVVREMDKAKSDEAHPEPVPFDLERALNDHPIQYRDGMQVYEWKHFPKAKIIVTIDEGGRTHVHDKEGKEKHEGKWDLVMVPQKKEYWVNVWMDKDGEIFTGEKTYRSKEDAESCIRPDLIKVGVSLVHEEIV